MDKNEIYEIEITDMTFDGNGIGHINGIAVFVPTLFIGDIAEIMIIRVLKSYCIGKALKIIKFSDDRIESDCPVSEKCGGCSFRCINYDAQLKFKQKAVADVFQRIGGFDLKPENIVGAKNYNRYRNKAQYPFALKDGKIVCGFYEKKSHNVVPYINCKLQPTIFSEILECVLELLNERKFSVYNEQTHTGILRHLYIRQGCHSGEIMVCFVVRKDISRELKYTVNRLISAFPMIKSIMLNINPNKTNVILGDKNVLLFGREYITDTMCGLKFDISANSFYQVNTVQAEKLYSIAKDYAELKKSDVLLDFYCGAGTIGLSMADSVKKIIGVEIIPDAIQNAISNAKRNGIENAEFICSDSGKAAEKIYSSGLKADVIIVDPPRKGCNEDMIKSICDFSPKKIVMISCNPSTVARDCKILVENGFQLEKYVPVDMFPFTNHVETVVLMSRVNID